MNLHISSFDLLVFSRNHRWVWSKRREREHTTRNQLKLQLFFSYTFREDMSATYPPATVHNKLPRSKQHNTRKKAAALFIRKSSILPVILHNTQEKAHGRTYRWRHSPLKKYWGGKGGGGVKYMQEKSIFPPLLAHVAGRFWSYLIVLSPDNERQSV